jgi:hypothetical protein
MPMIFIHRHYVRRTIHRLRMAQIAIRQDELKAEAAERRRLAGKGA